jgi:hypothetical protein
VNLDKTKKVKLLCAAFGEGILDHDADNIQLKCPSCKNQRKDKKKLCVQIDSGWFNCWVCNISGKSVHSLFRKHAKNFIESCDSLWPRDKNYDQQNYEQQNVVVELPSDFKFLVENLFDPDAKDVYRYLVERGLTKYDMCRWRICVSNEKGFRRKAIFPSYDQNGRLNFYTARAIDETPFKYKNADIKKTQIIFNEIDIDWKQPILLVEGVFDAIKCPDNTVVALGSSVPKQSLLYKRLTENCCDVIVAFDEDAEDKAHRVCKNLSQSNCNIYKVTIQGDDLGSRSKDDALNIIKKAKKWSQIDLIENKISKIRSGSIL